MNADSFFVIGKTHNICQDYALHVNGNQAFAVVSDGCSSSPDTDFGSRFLVKSAIESMSNGKIDALSVISKSAGCLSAIPMTDKHCLDATLLTAHEDEGSVFVNAWGDGVIVSLTETGDVFYWEISYSGGAPAYPSYLLETDRLERFYQEFGGKRTVKLFKPGVQAPISVTEIKASEDFGFHMEFKHVKMVMLCSDGVQSFIDSEFNTVPVSEIIRDLTDIRSFTGEFVKRNTKFFLSKICKNNGWTHGDDLGIAAIHL